MTTQIVLALISLISLGLLWAFLAWPWRDFRVDLQRQRLFAIRDQLFDLAADGAIRFDSPAYGQLRTTINGAIRFADRVDIVWLTVSLLMMSRPVRSAGSQYDELWRGNLADLSPDVVARLNRFRNDMNLEVARAMLEGAPQYWPLLALVGAGVVLHAVLRTFLRVTLREGEGALSRLQSYPGRLAARWAERLDATAFECGSLA